ncbi:hypothetical protein [Mangrovibacterium sp.]|uniref:hypothetical protein n=1 Tax=Mangrovibacterium sp. TaxID=1961364 RepID=UPI0035675E77
MNSSTKKVLLAFVFGMVFMFVLDMFFHFNNSVEKQIQCEADKTQKKIERIFK